MDEMNIVSEFTRKIISKFVQKAIRKKTDCDVGICLNAVNVTVTDGVTRIHLDLDAAITKEDLLKLLKNSGLS